MNTALLREEVQQYLASHEHTPVAKFIFKGSPFEDITIQELTQQLDGKRRVKNKLPLWFETPGVLFPPKLNLEQTSSSFTAIYKSKLVNGETLLDMTGGFGIDSYYFAQQVKEVHHVEMNQEVSAFAKANFKTLQAPNIKTYVSDSIAFLSESDQIYDTVYVDPARRNDIKGKVFKLEDCVPDVSLHLNFLLKKGKELIIKTAPLLDISAGLNDLKQVSEIHIIAVHNEVKEVLWRVLPSQIKGVHLITINKRANTIEQTSCMYSDLKEAVASYDLPQKYLYEPNAALLKAGAFNWVSTQYELYKLHPHSHLYTNDVLVDFPGRRFEILEVLPFTNKLKKYLAVDKANVTTRNFKLSVADLRKKLRIKEGGDQYLFFTTDQNENQIVIVCKKTE